MMKTLLKVVLALVAGVVLLILAAWLLVNPEDYRGKLSEMATDALGTEVRLEGGMQLQFWPSLGLATERLQVMQPSAFGEGVMLEAGEVSFSAAVVPLLQGELALEEIHLRGVRLKLLRKADGSANWERLQPGGGREVGQDAQSVAAAPIPLKLAGLYLDDVQLEYVDEKADQRQSLHIQRLALEGLGGAEAASMELTAELRLPEPLQLELGTTLKTSDDFTRIELPTLSLRLHGDRLPQPVEVTADLLLDTGQGRVEIRDMRLVDALTLRGSLGRRVDLHLQADAMDLKPWLRETGVELATDATLELDMRVQGSGEKLHLALQKLRLGSLELKGRADWDGSLKARFEADTLRLEDWLPAAEATTDAAAEPVADAPLLTPEQLPKLKAEVELTLASLEAHGLKMRDVSMRLETRPGQVELTGLKATLYEGTLEAGAVLKARGNEVELQSRGQVRAVQAEPLLQDLVGKKLLSGQGELEWNIQTRLTGLQAMKANLQGQAGLRFQDGAVLGINVAEKIRQAWALLKGQPYRPPAEPPKTDFAELSASLRMQAGRVENDDLMLKSPLLRVTGNGWLDLAQEQVNYNLRPVVVGTLRGQNGEELRQLKGVPIPLKIKGALASPAIKLDLARALGETQKKKLKKKAEKEVMKLLFGRKKGEEDKPADPP